MPHLSAIILSAEFIGLQNLVDQLAPRDINPLMKSIYELIDPPIRLNQAYFNRYTGDTFLAVFEKSKSDHSASLRALNAAYEIKELLRSHWEEQHLESPLDLKFGIAAGNIYIGEIPSENEKQKTVLGDGLKFANRICQFASKNQIIIDKKTYEEVKASFDFQALEPIPMEGGLHSIEIFEALQKKKIKLHLKGVSERQILSEMVGRDHESEQLENLILKLIAGKGSVVNIVGKAGVGKSRLMAEMKVQPFMKKILLLEGRALSTGQNLSYHPIIDLIKSWAQITEEDLPDVSSEKLHRGIQHIAPNQADDIFSFVATMMGLPISGKYKERVEGIEGEALEKLILKNLRDLIISATKDKPRIYLVEDMHWADSSSITLFESLYKLSQNYPVMFINVLRPGYKETGDYILKWLVDQLPADHTTIPVSPLGDKESAELIDNLLKKTSIPDRVAKTIIRKTEGNPFFIEEVIRSFLDEGIIKIHDKEFRVTEKINEVNIPETISDVILSRVDKLDEKTKELLKTASVIGQNFYFKVLEEAANTIGELDDRLEYLQEVQLISENKKKDEIAYLFKHALAQQATYESILKDSRKTLHLKIARSIEKVFSKNLHKFYATLAHHYAEAEEVSQAEKYLFLAGKESLNSGGPLEALNFLNKGLELYMTLSEGAIEDQRLADYYYFLAISYYSTGYNIETISCINKFERINKTNLPDHKTSLWVGTILKLIKLILAVNFKSYYFKKPPTSLDDIFIKTFAAKAESMVTIDPKRVFFEVIYFSSRLIQWDLSKTQFGEGVFAEISGNFIWTGISVPLGRKILKVSESSIRKEKKLSWMKFRYPKLMTRLFIGEFTPDEDEDEVYHIGLSAGAFWETTTYLFFSTYIHIETGSFERAQTISKRILEVASTFENVHSKSQYYRISSVLFMKFRKLEELIPLSEEGIDFTSKTGHLAVTLVIQSCRVIALSLTNQLHEAAEILNKARPIALERKRGVIFYSSYLLAKCHYEIALAKMTMRHQKLQRNHQKKLMRYSKEMLHYAKKYCGNLVEAYRLSGIIYHMIEKDKKARMCFSDSISFGKSSGSRLELSRAYFETGKFLSDPNVKFRELDGKTASHYLEKAKSMFEEMDLQWDLEAYRRFTSH